MFLHLAPPLFSWYVPSERLRHINGFSAATMLTLAATMRVLPVSAPRKHIQDLVERSLTALVLAVPAIAGGGAPAAIAGVVGNASSVGTSSGCASCNIKKQAGDDRKS